MKEFKHPFHSVLPIPAQIELMKAAQVKNTPSDPMARRKAMDLAIERVKTRYPTYFRGGRNTKQHKGHSHD